MSLSRKGAASKRLVAYIIFCASIFTTTLAVFGKAFYASHLYYGLLAAFVAIALGLGVLVIALNGSD